MQGLPVTLLLASWCTLTLGYPGGPPSCTSSPNHGGGQGADITLQVIEVSDKTWQVTVPEKHKGLTLNSNISGNWDPPGAGYKKKGKCITHANRSNKNSKSFTFRANSGETPVISGFLVKGYSSSHSALRS